MLVQEVSKILSKFKEEEDKVENLLKQISNEKDAIKLKRKTATCAQVYLSRDEAIKRNNAILKELETVKGNLRSKAIYSPMEMRWEEICKRYQANPSLPVTTWKCHLPVYV